MTEATPKLIATIWLRCGGAYPPSRCRRSIGVVRLTTFEHAAAELSVESEGHSLGRVWKISRRQEYLDAADN